MHITLCILFGPNPPRRRQWISWPRGQTPVERKIRSPKPHKSLPLCNEETELIEKTAKGPIKVILSIAQKRRALFLNLQSDWQCYFKEPAVTASILCSKEELIRKSSVQRNWISGAAQTCSINLFNDMFIAGVEPDLCKPHIKEKRSPPKAGFKCRPK